MSDSIEERVTRTDVSMIIFLPCCVAQLRRRATTMRPRGSAWIYKTNFTTGNYQVESIFMVARSVALNISTILGNEIDTHQ